nr:type I restriction enzyme HsdR N-terminal domain-containing protein [Leifsonia shinshuensis]
MSRCGARVGQDGVPTPDQKPHIRSDENERNFVSIQTIAPHGGFAIVPPGKVLDYIDGVTLRQDTPEEYVRQEILKSLVREYGYDKADIRVEFPIKFGSRRVRVDIVVFPPGLKATEQTQSSAWLIIECKNDKVRPSMKKDGVEQMLSYMAACPNVEVGMWTNGEDMSSYAFEVDASGKRIEVEIPDIPHSGDTADAGTPRFDQLRPAASDSLLFAFRRAHSYTSQATRACRSPKRSGSC